MIRIIFRPVHINKIADRENPLTDQWFYGQYYLHIYAKYALLYKKNVIIYYLC